MKNLKYKILFLSTLYFLLSTFLIGCATAPSVPRSKFTKIVRIDGARYISAESLCQMYNLDYYWDPITKKAVFIKDAQEVSIMVNSSTVLLGDSVRTMEQEARLYQGSVVIPQTFARKTLIPFFRREFVERTPTIRSKGMSRIETVIIDAGHGGKDPGAIGREGLQEKDVVLDIAKRLKRKLNAAGKDVIMTRATDRFIPLTQRAHIANTKESDFFISIHANASRSRWTSGVEVFYLSESVDDELRSFNAAKKYDLNLKEAYSGKYTAAILWDLIYREDRKSSLEMARQISRSLSKKLSQRNRGKKPARFFVLKANIPAVLVEVGFISNPREEKRLRSSAYRDKIAQAITNGIIQYEK